MSRTRLLVWGAALSVALVMAACGGGDTGGEPPATTTTTSAAAPSDAPTTSAAVATSAAPTTEAPTNGGSGGGLGENIAIVTIGDSEYRFDATMSVVGRCDPSFFGAFWVIAAAADGSSGGLEMLIIPEGTEGHNETSKVNVNLKDTEERDWHAVEDGGEGAPAGVSRVESFSIDGNTVSGTASFVDVYQGDDATASGTFQATCPEA